MTRHFRRSIFVPMMSTILIVSSLVPNLFAGEPGTKVIKSTVPSNGDVNPYGIFEIPDTVGRLVKGNLLIVTSTPSRTFRALGPRSCRFRQAVLSASSPKLALKVFPALAPEAWG